MRGSAHEHGAGIAHQRRACIRHERDRLALLQAREQRRHALALVVLVQRFQRAALDATGLEQPTRVARVLREQQVGVPEARRGARAQVLQVADRRRDDE